MIPSEPGLRDARVPRWGNLYPSIPNTIAMHAFVERVEAVVDEHGIVFCAYSCTRSEN